MNYQIGDKVIHWTHGTGRIIGIDEKDIAGTKRQYYVVDTGTLTLFISTDETGETSIRPPTESFEFKAVVNSLRSPGNTLPERHFERKSQLGERMRKRKLVDVCGVIRDLTTRSRLHDLNFNDRSVLRQAEECLLDEWEISLGSTRLTALRDLGALLGDE